MHTNRLAGEKSPYLLQHAHNPVDWYPWGEEALAAAREQQKPIFLSVGYSTCHWCHVMERESFENEAIAALMNRYFICIKVDREERPDIDMLYMSALQGMTGQGGWPMSVFLTPDLEPFFAGTYFPPENAMGRPGFAALIEQIGRAWESDRDRILQHGEQVASALAARAADMGSASSGPDLTASVLEDAFEALERSHDDELGGFGSAPKFPMPHYVRFLFRYAARTGEARAREIATRTLDAMAMGGLHDHLAGGFHRYSTDRQWLVPHFEKMLYDQAGLALAYTDAWLVTGEDAYRAVTEGILDYVLSYLSDPEGGFTSAEDADSEGEEGTFYVWTAAEIDEVLGERGPAFRAAYDVSDGGNWEGKSILHTTSLAPLLDPGFAADRETLRARRDTRPRPHLDDKIIVAWNGSMIEAFARAGRAFDEPRYVDAAVAAATFVETHLWRDGRLLRHYRGGAADVPAYLEDYAFLARGLLALYEATFDVQWLERAHAVAADLTTRFTDDRGVLTFYGRDQEQLLAPVVEEYDGAMPSGASVAAGALLRIGHLTADREMEARGGAVIGSYARGVSRQPTTMLELLAALDFSLGPITEVVIAGDATDPIVDGMRRAVAGGYRPNTVTAYRPIGDAPEVTRLVPYLAEQVAVDGRATAYVCRDYACRLPVHDRAALVRELHTEGQR